MNFNIDSLSVEELQFYYIEIGIALKKQNANLQPVYKKKNPFLL